MLSVLCAEDVPYLNVKNARQAAHGTVLGSYWVDQVVAACRVWPRGKVPADWRRPFKVELPTLLISGVLDPATPPAEAEVTRRYLPSSLHVVAPGGSHSFTGMDGCVDVIMSEFVSSGSLESLKTDCIARIKPPPFES
jgi:pimeloyl-ACP methyl ester carboxylesterase